jgi:site-specific recombinase XerD
MFDRARDAAGLEGGVHKLRHTFASHFLAKEPDMYLLAQVLGHSYTQVTERYAHLLPSHLARARDVVSITGPEINDLTRKGTE